DYNVATNVESAELGISAINCNQEKLQDTTLSVQQDAAPFNASNSRLYFGSSRGAGGLDSLTLNSLYDKGAYRASQQPVYGSPTPNQFEAAGPFGMSAPAGQMTLFQANPSSVWEFA
ncbi:hypothetical protein Tco_0686251, partial [Tanacetum coccineum]